jgi:hypothetical protein
MTEHDNDRRKAQELFYDAIVDRREREQTVPAQPGTIRPAPGVVPPAIERRRFPESGSE